MVVMLVILMGTTAVIIGTFMVSLVGVYKRRREEKALFSSSFPADAAEPVIMPFLFDRPSRWIAVRCSNIVKVQTALALDNPTPPAPGRKGSPGCRIASFSFLRPSRAGALLWARACPIPVRIPTGSFIF